jgi:hypothetical protein
MDADPDYLQENVSLQPPEHDMVAFDLVGRRWRNHLPEAWQEEWARKLPPVFVPRTYSGLTAGSERSLFRPPDGYTAEAARPDVNIVFDEVAYHPGSKSLVYFTGGLTAAYDVPRRRWSNLAPAHSPPPVLGGALAHDPVNNELVLFGGGHVAEAGPDGRIVGYTGTWVYSFAARDWRRLRLDVQPPPRMYSPLVCDTKNQVLVLFGGGKDRDALWAFGLKANRWKDLAPKVAAPKGAAPPVCNREAVYLPAQDVFLTYGPAPGKERAPALWTYRGEENAWHRIDLAPPPGIDPRSAAGQNRALLYDAARDLVLLVLGANDRGDSLVYALRYRDDQAKRRMVKIIGRGASGNRA